MPPSHQLFLKSGKRYRDITTLDSRKRNRSLAGSVEIRTKAEALSFVRLLTSPATVDAWDDIAALEICSKTSLGRNHLFGIEQTMGCALFEPVVSAEKELSQNGMSSPTVTKNGNKYGVVRWLLAISLGDGRLRSSVICIKVKELVGRNGAYSRQILQRKEVPSGYHWDIIPGR